jgi:hypothetical protein
LSCLNKYIFIFKKEIQTGSIVIRNNKNLCLNNINWYDILPNSLLFNRSMISDYRPIHECKLCSEQNKLKNKEA